MNILFDYHNMDIQSFDGWLWRTYELEGRETCNRKLKVFA